MHRDAANSLAPFAPAAACQAVPRAAQSPPRARLPAAPQAVQSVTARLSPPPVQQDYPLQHPAAASAAAARNLNACHCRHCRRWRQCRHLAQRGPDPGPG
eukprot:359068-Chlamydomonas_euryale.AAC.5